MIALLTLLLLAPTDTLHLEMCYQLAEAHHPRRQELGVHDQIAALRMDNLSARFLPAVSLQSQAAYQSNLPSFPITLPGVSGPDISHDQYRVSLNVDQLILDGGATRQQREVEQIQRDLARQEVEVEVYQVRPAVNNAYFGALAAEARLASLRALAQDLEARHLRLEAQVRAGVVTPGNADVLAVERLKVDQQIAETESTRLTALAVLATLIGQPVPDETALAWPDAPTDLPPNTQTRPEYTVFSLQESLFSARAELAGTQTRPRVTGFAEAAYGRPAGLDLFDNQFQPFYSFGVRVRWGFWDWNTSRRETQTLSFQRDLLAARRDAFTQQVDLAIQEHLQAVERLEALMRQDDEIIALRARIAAAAASQLENGVATATDYLIERNAEQQARLTRDLHALQLLRSRIDYATLLAHGD